ncbi:hypothetical protein CW304_01455 [Bacillus sp. UFRGS-B20]|nr:hypothetical protein CW304_01455 [Bacillus sp. UFRGS-B20]
MIPLLWLLSYRFYIYASHMHSFPKVYLKQSLYTMRQASLRDSISNHSSLKTVLRNPTLLMPHEPSSYRIHPIDNNKLEALVLL